MQTQTGQRQGNHCRIRQGDGDQRGPGCRRHYSANPAREDSLCYLGNAEFCLLYPATNGIGAITAVNRIFGQVSGKKIAIAGKRVPVTLSGTIYSCIATEEIDLDIIMPRLDAGLAEVQTGDGNQIVGSSSSERRDFSIDRALKLIESGQVEDLSAHAAGLMMTVLPLLEFADGVLQLDLESINRRLRVHLESAPGSSN